jgi:hypothetical protein
MREIITGITGEEEERLSKEIVQKCHPAIFEIAHLWKESIEGLNALGANPPAELAAKLEDHFKKRQAEIEQRYSGPVTPTPNRFATDVIFSAAPDERIKTLAEFLHWQRHKVPCKKDLQANEGKAARRALRTASDLVGLLYDREKPKRFKGDFEHSGMFDVLWGFGVESLTPAALAYFFECFCPCGAEQHDPENLRKQRGRYSKDLASGL